MIITQHAHIYSFHTSKFNFGEIFFVIFLSIQPLVQVRTIIVPRFWLGILLCHVQCPVSQASYWWHRVLSGLRLDSLFYLRALGMLSLTCKSIILLWVQEGIICGYGSSLKSIPCLGYASSLVNNQVVHRCLSLASYSTVIGAYKCLFQLNILQRRC